jgi:hypothetical protein
MNLCLILLAHRPTDDCAATCHEGTNTRKFAKGHTTNILWFGATKKNSANSAQADHERAFELCHLIAVLQPSAYRIFMLQNQSALGLQDQGVRIEPIHLHVPKSD